VDYKEVLKPEEFEVFSRLRDWRKNVAEKEGVPVYAVLTNEQLAQMVQKQVKSKAGLEGDRRRGRCPRREVWGRLAAIAGGLGEGMRRLGQLLAAIADPGNLRCPVCVGPVS
jgi:ribonuclease D